jgi:hypothetical protein
MGQIFSFLPCLKSDAAILVESGEKTIGPGKFVAGLWE